MLGPHFCCCHLHLQWRCYSGLRHLHDSSSCRRLRQFLLYRVEQVWGDLRRLQGLGQSSRQAPMGRDEKCEPVGRSARQHSGMAAQQNVAGRAVPQSKVVQHRLHRLPRYPLGVAHSHSG